MLLSPIDQRTKRSKTMSRSPVLDPTLQEILQVIKPTRADWDNRISVIDQLRTVLESVESLKGATIEPFGSFVSNLFTRWGDLDISVDLFSGSSILFTGKKHKQTLLGQLLRALRASGGWYKLQFVIHARVPILKIESWHQKISCDISIDNLEGLLKSRFLFWISEMDGRFRDLVLLVKEWAKAHNINNPKNGTFNSYSLSLLVIFHLQTCVPAILPPLREIYPRSAVDDLKGVRKTAEESIAQLAAANIARFKSGASKSVNRSSLSELLISFFAKFSDINVKAQELGVCPFTGRWENISSNTTWLPKTYSLFVEDPFEQPENAARSVSRKNLDRIAQAFQMTSRCLASDGNRDSIIGVLTARHISESLCRTNLPNHQHQRANSVHSARNPHGQSRPWNHRVQQNWSQSNNIPNPAYWPAPTLSRPKQHWPQNNHGNMQVHTRVQGQAWPVTTQTRLQQKSTPRSLRGQTPVQGQTWPVTTQTRPQQKSNPRNLQGQTPVQGQAWPVTTQTQMQQNSQYNKNGKRPIKNTSAGSSQNQGHTGPGQMNGSARSAQISQIQGATMWKPRS